MVQRQLKDNVYTRTTSRVTVRADTQILVYTVQAKPKNRRDRSMKFSKLTRPEFEEILKNANFTEEEAEIFNLLSQGKSITEIALYMSLCNRTINRKIKNIKVKIERLKLWLK